MGQYFFIANLDKKEYICTWDVDSGAKFLEILCNNIARLVPYLLRKSDEGGGGDIDNFNELEYCGRWACDRIVIIGDYDSSELYSEIREFDKVIDWEDCRIK